MEKLFQDLIQAYDSAAEERDKSEQALWKLDLRRSFLDRIRREGKSSLVDIGAGTGVHGEFFQQQGISVTCIDLSPTNIEKCHEKGLDGIVLNILDLAELGRSFDSAFAMNSLLHMPYAELPRALSSIAATLNPGGLFFWGQYGGEFKEGPYSDDRYKPKRFFSLLDDQQIQAAAEGSYKIEQFQVIDLSGATLHFQSLTLRVPPL
jgi:2-polyprenyl-3-methyl-5-hydroxy-6-metoxy-1,4-benzoquinol methylase